MNCTEPKKGQAENGKEVILSVFPLYGCNYNLTLSLARVVL